MREQQRNVTFLLLQTFFGELPLFLRGKEGSTEKSSWSITAFWWHRDRNFDPDRGYTLVSYSTCLAHETQHFCHAMKQSKNHSWHWKMFRDVNMPSPKLPFPVPLWGRCLMGKNRGTEGLVCSPFTVWWAGARPAEGPGVPAPWTLFSHFSEGLPKWHNKYSRGSFLFKRFNRLAISYSHFERKLSKMKPNIN